jgi:hypothetical protein
MKRLGVKETRIKKENIDAHRTICSLVYLKIRHKNDEKREKTRKNK